MDPSSDNLRPIIILGPTAGGKSELAVRLCESLPESGEVISADSMQIYRYMDAGTAKPNLDQRTRAPHQMIDVVEPTDRYTVSHWLTQTESHLTRLKSENKRPIIVGGTNLYLNALLQGMFEGPGEDPDFRTSLSDIHEHDLHTRLSKVDPEAVSRIFPNDRKRIIRALEVHHLTGRPISDWQKQWDAEKLKPYRHNPILIGLEWPVDPINSRINLRVKAMFYPEKVDSELAREVCLNGESLVDETRRLESANLLGKQAREALGYKQVLDYLNRNLSLTESFERTKILTRRFAKQQRTWLRRYRNVHWIPAHDKSDDDRLSATLNILKSI
ncbi:IPP transferase [Poriferisphaera corsica]|uniref:tRNA dimethylallyltransferase n=1 Tax=Poriferisphaera corsica TaxID=2528020 RepID=A0A517YWN3_9BACT|nr:tRNA (adenosine(37)-N6)-dimethylallyltransferase MiaA [Poriferisphaera corsica]QDU34638.1 IPP transferase [Poriferisphaera corsica]